MHLSTLHLAIAALLPFAYSTAIKNSPSSSASIVAKDIVPDEYFLGYQANASDSDVLNHHSLIQTVTGSPPVSVYNISNFRAVHIKAKAANLAEISTPIVKYIEVLGMINSPTMAIKPIEKRGTLTTQSNVAWGLGRISRSTPTSDGENYKYDSSACAGTYIYILDTGINVAHSEFSGNRAIWGANTVDDVQSDMNGHGTHVAGIAVGTRYGVCKKATVISVKVLSQIREKNTAAALANGIAWAWAFASGTSTLSKSVINLSLTLDGPSQTVDGLINAIGLNDVLIVAASGNDGTPTGINSPSSAARSFVVGMVSKDNKMDYRSGWGPRVDLMAPGVDIVSAGIRDANSFETMSGTSMAAPFVSGVAAYFLGMSSTVGFSLLPQDLKNILASKAVTNQLTELKPGTTNRLLNNANGLQFFQG